MVDSQWKRVGVRMFMLEKMRVLVALGVVSHLLKHQRMAADFTE